MVRLEIYMTVNTDYSLLGCCDIKSSRQVCATVFLTVP